MDAAALHAKLDALTDLVQRQSEEIRLLRAQTPKERELLSMRAAAAALGIHRNLTLPKLIKQGVIRAVPVGKRMRIPRDEIERVKRDGLLAFHLHQSKRKQKKAPGAPTSLDSWRPPT